MNCRRWLVPEWNRFKIGFKQVVERSWNNQMSLLPTEGEYGDALSDENYRQGEAVTPQDCPACARAVRLDDGAQNPL